MATRAEIIAELKTRGFTDEQIAAKLPQQAPQQQQEVGQQQAPTAQQPQQAVPIQNPNRQAIIDELTSRGVTEEQFLQQGTSTVAGDGGKQKILEFAQKQQAAQEQRAGALRSVAESTTPLEAGLASAGRSFKKAGRVISSVNPLSDVTAAERKAERELEQEQFAALSEANPVSTFVGGVVGDVAVGLPIGGPVAGTIRKQAGKFINKKIAAIGGAAAAGAIEETLIEGNPILGLAFGAGGEVALPILGNAMKAAYRKLTGNANPSLTPTGSLTPEALEELEASGFTVNDLGADVERTLAEAFDPEVTALARQNQAEAAFFDSRQTSSKASQSAELQALEADALAERGKIAQAAEDILSKNQTDLVRGAERRVLEPLGSSQTIFNIQDVANRGNKTEAGRLTRDFLKRNKDIGKDNVNQLYSAARNLEGSDAIVSGAGISETLIQFADSATDELQNKVLKALAKFKIVGDDAVDLGAGNFRTKVGETNINFRSSRAPQQLSVGNAEELRKMLNTFPVQSASDSALIVQLKNSLDRATADAVESLPEASTKRGAFEAARNAASKLKEAYEDNDIIESLLTFKDFKGTIPAVPDSEIIDKFVKGGRALQNSQRLKGMLLTSPQGKEIWNDIRASVGEDLLRNSLRKNSRNEWVLSFNNLDRQLKNIGTEKLKVFFDPKELKVLERLKGVLKTTDTPLARVSSTSGSGEVAANAAFKILDTLSTMGLGFRITGATDLANKAVNKSQASIIRQKELQDGLASIEGRRLSKKERQLSRGAKIQSFLQQIAADVSEVSRGQVGTAVLSEAQDRVLPQTETQEQVQQQ